jgi:hypothetical protein
MRGACAIWTIRIASPLPPCYWKRCCVNFLLMRRILMVVERFVADEFFLSLSFFKIYKLIIFVFLTFQLPHSFFYIFIKKNVITLAYDGDIKRWMLSNYQYNTIISCLTYLNLYQLNSRQDRFLVGPKSGSGDRSIAIA